jgi:predicted membrane-bound spermidine synthase
MKNNPFAIIITAVIGLIPNCSTSILLTELYLKDLISVGKLIGGLLVNSGVGLLILIRYNKNSKENLKTIIILLLIGIIVGFIFDIFKITL